MGERPADERDVQAGVEDLVAGVAGVLTASLGVGAALARTVAKATAADGQAPHPAEHAGPLQELIFYSFSALGNVVGLVGSSVGDAVRLRPTSAASAPGVGVEPAPSVAPASGVSAVAGGLPRVRQGATLRVPLSIENRGDAPMEGLTFSCVSVSGRAAGPGEPLGAEALRFEPESFSVAPRDFEKLTVFVDVAPDTAPGRYEAQIIMGQVGFETTLRFDVVEAA
jgi:hypothetical protein